MSAKPLGHQILDLTRVLLQVPCRRRCWPISAAGDQDRGGPAPATITQAHSELPVPGRPESKASSQQFVLPLRQPPAKKSVTVQHRQSRKGEGRVIRELASKDLRRDDGEIIKSTISSVYYRLDYESIKAINPGIIYCSVTGFGQTGPYAGRAGYDAILQAMGGLMSVTGHIDGEPGEGPMKVGPSIVDYMTGMNTSIGILTALYHRKVNGGVGQHVDVCLFRHRDRLAVALAADLRNRQRQDAAAPRQPGAMAACRPACSAAPTAS